VKRTALLLRDLQSPRPRRLPAAVRMVQFRVFDGSSPLFCSPFSLLSVCRFPAFLFIVFLFFVIRFLVFRCLSFSRCQGVEVEQDWSRLKQGWSKIEQGWSRIGGFATADMIGAFSVQCFPFLPSVAGLNSRKKGVSPRRSRPSASAARRRT